MLREPIHIDKPKLGAACIAKFRSMGSFTVGECSTCIGKLHDDEQNFRSEGAYCRLLSGYMSNLHRGPTKVEEMIQRDLQGMQGLGAHKYALDLKIILEWFLSKFPTGGEGEQ